MYYSYVISYSYCTNRVFKFGVGLKNIYFMLTEACIYLIKKTV